MWSEKIDYTHNFIKIKPISLTLRIKFTGILISLTKYTDKINKFAAVLF